MGRKPKEVERRVKKKDSKEDEARTIFEAEVERTSKEIDEIKKLKTDKVGRIWDIEKRIVGGKKGTLEATAIVNPKNGKLAVKKDQIKTVTLQYCKETLENNKPAEGFEDIIEAKKVQLEKNLLECNGNFKPTKEGFQTLIRKFKSSRKQNYDFLVKASEEFQEAVFKFSKILIEKEEFPKCFKETTLHMIFKGGKGKREKLSHNRFIH